jgi:hypothetical protein
MRTIRGSSRAAPGERSPAGSHDGSCRSGCRC